MQCISTEKLILLVPSPNNVSSLPVPTSRNVPVSSFKSKTTAQDFRAKTYNEA